MKMDQGRFKSKFPSNSKRNIVTIEAARSIDRLKLFRNKTVQFLEVFADFNLVYDPDQPLFGFLKDDFLEPPLVAVFPSIFINKTVCSDMNRLSQSRWLFEPDSFSTSQDSCLTAVLLYQIGQPIAHRISLQANLRKLDYWKLLGSDCKNSANRLTGSTLRCRQTITNSTISNRLSPRSNFETYDWGTSSFDASSTWLMWARLRTPLRKSPKLSFSLWKSLRYRTCLGLNILSKVILRWVITNERIFLCASKEHRSSEENTNVK